VLSLLPILESPIPDRVSPKAGVPEGLRDPAAGETRRL
jgi:hypothetical protein